MLDDRWGDDEQALADGLAALLGKACDTTAVRDAEAAPDGRAANLETQLDTFGLWALPPDPGLLAAAAEQLGRFLAPVPFPERAAVKATTGLDAVWAERGWAPAFGMPIVTIGAGGSLVAALPGPPQRSAAGDVVVPIEVTGPDALTPLFGTSMSDPRKVGIVRTLRGNEGRDDATEPFPEAESGLGHTLRPERGGLQLPGGFQADPAAADRGRRLVRLLSAARAVGAAGAVLDLGVAYARERQQFGRAIGSFQAVAHRLADAATAVDGAALAVRKAAWVGRVEQGGDGAPDAMFCAIARSRAEAAAEAAVAAVHQVMGGVGFTVEADCQLYSRRIRAWRLRLDPVGPELAALARTLLSADGRDGARWLWHHDRGLPLPRWAEESDA